MKTITFPVGYRPNYLKQFLDSLATQNLEGYTIICSAENHFGCLNILRTHGLPITILRKPNSSGQKSHSGARDNMYNVLNYAFKNGSTFNVHLEDDFILSPDALDLANWYYENFKGRPLDYMSYGLFNWVKAGNDFSGLTTVGDFYGLGWCTFKEGWDQYYNKYWYEDTLARKHFGSYGWDWAMKALCKEFGYKSIVPLISRTYHVGRIDGTCCTVDFFDKTYTDLIWNKTEKVTKFELRGGLEKTHIHP
jgi:hypothetical protein